MFECRYITCSCVHKEADYHAKSYYDAPRFDRFSAHAVEHRHAADVALWIRWKVRQKEFINTKLGLKQKAFRFVISNDELNDTSEEIPGSQSKWSALR